MAEFRSANVQWGYHIVFLSAGSLMFLVSMLHALGVPTESPCASATTCPRVAVCVFGQLRTMRSRGLHVYLKKHLVDVLHADLFMHVDVADTYIDTHVNKQNAEKDSHVKSKTSSLDVEEIMRVLKPRSVKLATYEAPPVPPSKCATSGSGSGAKGGRRICTNMECGGYTCGCYVDGCTDCVMARSIPQYRHTSECIKMIAMHERARGSEYDMVIKWRPDVNITRPLPTFEEIARLLSPPGSSPADRESLCGPGVVEYPLPLPEYPHTINDAFGFMPRRVAAVYFNATSAFEQCQSREVNGPDCKLPATPWGPNGKSTRIQLRGNKDPAAWAMHLFGVKEVPLWATPECVFKRHLLAHMPQLRMIDCLRGEDFRLVRGTGRHH